MKKKIFAVLTAALASIAGMTSCGNCNKDAANAEEVAVVAVEEEVVPVSKVVEITSEDYQKKVATTDKPGVYLGQEPCIIDFWATWCGPCMRLTPVLHNVSEQTGITVYKVNVDEAVDLVEAYGIESIPALFLAADGKIIPYEGDRSETHLVKTANGLLGK